MTNDLQQRAKAFHPKTNQGDFFYNGEIKRMADFAAAEIARREAEIADELKELYTKADSMTEFGEEAHAWIERQRAKL